MRKIGLWITPNGEFLDIYRIGNEIVKIPAGLRYEETIEALATVSGRDALEISALFSVYAKLREPLALHMTAAEQHQAIETLRSALAMLYRFFDLD